MNRLADAPASPPNGVDLDAVFGALSNHTRRTMLHLLGDGPATVNELAAPFDMSLPAISKHIGVLERAGLVSRTREGQSRPVRLERDALLHAMSWVDQQRQIWDDSLDRLNDRLAETTNPKDRNQP